jgi:hypothetical protein
VSIKTRGRAGAVIMLAAATVLPVVTAAPASAAVHRPTITHLSAITGPVAGGQRIVIHGRHFTKGDQVLFGGTRGRRVHILTSRTLTVVAPRHRAGRVDVRIAVKIDRPGTIALLPTYSARTRHDRYTFYAPPTIASVSVSSGPLHGGGTVTIGGRDFRGVSSVRFGAVRATRVHALSTARLVVVVPAHAAGTVNVRVTGRYGTSPANLRDRFSYVAPPSVTAVVAAAGPDVGGSTVTVVGSGFTHVTAVRFGGVLAGAINVLSASWLTVASPRHVAGAAEVRVTTAYGTSAASAADRYQFQPTSRILAWGTDIAGSLGDGLLQDRLVPAEIRGLDGASTVLADPYAGGVELMPDGTVRTWGIGTLRYASTPATVPGLSQVTQIATSGGTHYALRKDGTVWAWGDDQAGELGDGSVRTDGCLCRPRPLAVPGLDHVIQVVGGYLSAYAVRDDGTLWGWGKNQYGSLGVGSSEANVPVPTQLPGLTGVTSVVATIQRGYALTADGSVWSWGCCGAVLGTGVAIGVSPTPAKIFGLPAVTNVTIAGGGAFAFADDGTVYSWGYDAVGNTWDSHPTPVAVPQLKGFTSIASGNGANFGIGPDGRVYAWGDNYYGQLGLGYRSDVPVATPTWVPALDGVTAISTADYWTFAYRPPY